MWTHFWDTHSGGKLKEKQQHIFIEAPEEEAILKKEKEMYQNKVMFGQIKEKEMSLNYKIYFEAERGKTLCFEHAVKRVITGERIFSK